MATVLPSSNASDNRKEVIKLLNPPLFFQSGHFNTYITLLSSLGTIYFCSDLLYFFDFLTTQVSVPNNLSSEEQKMLITQFNLSTCLVNLMKEAVVDITTLFEILVSYPPYSL